MEALFKLPELSPDFVIVSKDQCHRNKKKCSGQRPICSNCAKSNRGCTYARSHKKKETRSAYVVELENRLLQIEGMLASEGLVSESYSKDFGLPLKPGKKGWTSTGLSADQDESEDLDDGYGLDDEDDDAGLGGDYSEDVSEDTGSEEDLDRISALRKRIEEVGHLADLRMQKNRRTQSASGNQLPAFSLPASNAVEVLSLDDFGQFDMSSNYPAPSVLAPDDMAKVREKLEESRRRQQARDIKKLADSLFVGIEQAEDGTMNLPAGIDQKDLQSLLEQLYAGNMDPGTAPSMASSSVGDLNDDEYVNDYQTAGFAQQPSQQSQNAAGKRRRTENAVAAAITTASETSASAAPSLPSAHLQFENDFADSILFPLSDIPEPEPEPAGDPLAKALLVRDQTTSTNKELSRVRREGRGFGMDEVGLATMEMGMLSGSEPLSPFPANRRERDQAEQLLEDMNALSINNHNPSAGLLQIMGRLVPPVQFRPDLVETFFKRAGGWTASVFVPKILREMEEGCPSPIRGWAVCACALVYTDHNDGRKTGYNPESEVFFARAKRWVLLFGPFSRTY